MKEICHIKISSIKNFKFKNVEDQIGEIVKFHINGYDYEVFFTTITIDIVNNKITMNLND